jgi:hypothetical protein
LAAVVGVSSGAIVADDVGAGVFAAVEVVVGIGGTVGNVRAVRGAADVMPAPVGGTVDDVAAVPGGAVKAVADVLVGTVPVVADCVVGIADVAAAVGDSVGVVAAVVGVDGEGTVGVLAATTSFGCSSSGVESVTLVGVVPVLVIGAIVTLTAIGLGVASGLVKLTDLFKLLVHWSCSQPSMAAAPVLSLSL